MNYSTIFVCKLTVHTASLEMTQLCHSSQTVVLLCTYDHQMYRKRHKTRFIGLVSFPAIGQAHTAAEYAQDVLLGARHTVRIVGALRRAPTAVDVIVVVIGVAIRRLRRHDVIAALYLLEHAHQQVVNLVVQDGRHFDAATLVVSGEFL